MPDSLPSSLLPRALATSVSDNVFNEPSSIRACTTVAAKAAWLSASANAASTRFFTCAGIPPIESSASNKAKTSSFVGASGRSCNSLIASFISFISSCVISDPPSSSTMFVGSWYSALYSDKYCCSRCGRLAIKSSITSCVSVDSPVCSSRNVISNGTIPSRMFSKCFIMS